MDIKNNTKTPVGLPDGTVIGSKKTVTIENAVAKGWENHPVFKAFVDSGRLSINGKTSEAAKPQTLVEALAAAEKQQATPAKDEAKKTDAPATPTPAPAAATKTTPTPAS